MSNHVLEVGETTGEARKVLGRVEARGAFINLTLDGAGWLVVRLRGPQGRTCGVSLERHRS